MKLHLFPHLRWGLLALGVCASPALAAPAMIAAPVAARQAAPVQPTKIAWDCNLSNGGCRDRQTGEMRSRDEMRDRNIQRNNDARRRVDNGSSYRRGDWNNVKRSDWNNGPRGNWKRPPRGNWNNGPHGNWNNGHNGNWRYRPPYYGNYGSGVYLQFGVPAYRYVEPRYVAPRGVIRLSDGHVQWCYDRWRSYRAYDNSYQPLRGPRRLCLSPYS